MSTTTPAAASRRRRSVNTDAAPAVPPAVASLVASFHAANEAANAARKTADDKRKQLLKEMLGAGLKRVEIAGYLAEIKAAVRESIDIDALKKAVPEAIFMRCVSATKTAVTQHAGTAIVAQCAVSTTGEENVSVKKVG